MMYKQIFFIVVLLFFSNLNYSQNKNLIEENSYEKNIDYVEKRNFKEELTQKYSGKEFEYVEEIKKVEEKKKTLVNNMNFIEGLISFMAGVFPYLLGLIVVFIILKSFINPEAGFWKFGKSNRKITENLIYHEDEDIENADFEYLLKSAISKKDFRLATRYYYLILLKKLTSKEYIKYHKDKTNSEYLFELKNKQVKKEFSYISYIYNYVWYGEFDINQQKFDIIESNCKTFINRIN